jgi:O-antigen/teichoic acid export membrane protein
MLIVNSVRTGVELLSDVGINQNIISSKRGDTEEFYDTAWTLKAARGIVLGAICFFLASTLANFFGKPELKTVLPVAALIFVFTGFESTSTALLQKKKLVAKISIIDVAVALLSLIAHVTLALITPTIWALVLGSILMSAFGLISTYIIIPGVRHRIRVDPSSAREILVFGKWIFFSSIIYFFAMNFDRLYFAKQVALGELGVYSIARSLSDPISNVVVRATNMVVFPTVAAIRAGDPELRARLLHSRRAMLFCVAIGLAAFVSVSDVIVRLLFDARYTAAAVFLPLLLVGVWISILSTVNDSVMLGTARPAYPAIANAAKLVTFIIGVPIAFRYGGLSAAILVLNAGEGARYVVLWLLARRRHLGFVRDDLARTVLFFVSMLLARKFLWAVGVTGDVESLFPIATKLQLG